MGPAKPSGKKQDLQSTGNALVPYCRGTASLESRCKECAGSRPPVQRLSLCLQPDLRALRQYTVGGQLPRAHRVARGEAYRHPGCCRHWHVAGRSVHHAFRKLPLRSGHRLPAAAGRHAGRDYPLAGTGGGPSRIVADTVRMRWAGLSIRDFASQQIVAFHCVGDLAHVDRAWHYLYRIWLPSGAFEPADLPAMEMFVRLPEEIGWETFDLQTCIPVVRL